MKNPIRTLVVKGVEYWMVTLPKQGGGRHRRYFRTAGEAKTYLQRKRVELLNQGTASLAITDPQRVALLKAEELSALFNFARERGWCSENPLLDSQKAKVRSSDIAILSPTEFARLLQCASDETLPYWAIGGFAGLRSSELERLDWADVHLDSDLVEVKAAKSKTASRRFVPIRPALKMWLARYSRRKGKVAPPMLRKRLERDRKLAKIEPWPHNGLRHSFASYHAAEFQDGGMLALELGHRDQKLIFAHYRELVRPTEAHKYWDLRPETVRSISAIAG